MALAKRFKGPRQGFVSWWNVLRGGFETVEMDYGDMARRWQRAAAAGQRVLRWPGKAVAKRFKGPRQGFVSWWNVLRRFWNRLNGLWRHGQALAKGCGCRAMLCGDVARRWQRAKGPRQGFVSWWNVLRRFWNRLNGLWRHGQALAKGCRAKGPRQGCVSWWTVQAEVLAGQSRTPALIPGAAPPRPMLGRDRRIQFILPIYSDDWGIVYCGCNHITK